MGGRTRASAADRLRTEPEPRHRAGGDVEKFRFGPEFTSGLFSAWCESHGIELEFIQPRKPARNDFIESFNGSYRDGVLDAWVFIDLDQVREETERWLEEDNTVRSHESLGDISPIEFLNDRGHTEISTYARTQSEAVDRPTMRKVADGRLAGDGSALGPR